MRRRTAILGIGSLAIGGSAAVSTSAFTNVEAERQAAVDVQNDENSYLALQPADDDGDPVSDPGSGNRSPEAHEEPYAVIDEATGRLQLNITALNADATFTFPNLFVVQNQGSQDVTVTFQQRGAEPDVLTFFTKIGGEKEQITESNGVNVEDGESFAVGVDADTFGIDPNESIIDTLVVEASARGDSS